MYQASGVGVGLAEEPQLVYLPLWREALAWVEYIELKTSRVYYGLGVPHGDDSPVVVVPGLLASDFYLLEMRLWLRRIGYRAYRSRIGVNADCPDILTRRLLKTVMRVHSVHHRKVHLIAHSLGGLLARSVAYQAPDKVASVITLASPFQGVRINPFVGKLLGLIRSRVSSRLDCPSPDCFSPACTCHFSNTLKCVFPAHVRQTALYTKRDGVVDWRTCMTGRPKTDFEVGSTHVGMAWNAQVYRILAERLAWAAARH